MRPKILWIVVAVLGFFLVAQTASAQTISTVAGGGDYPGAIPPYTSDQIGDEGSALEAYLNYPFGVSTISVLVGGVRQTIIYIADKENNRIRQVATDGTITTVVGNGIADFTGDGGPATEASLDGPESVAAVKERISGVMQTVLYISDTNNHRIRRAIVGGNIATLAGGGATSSADSDGGVILPATSVSLLRPSQIVALRALRVTVASRSRVPQFKTLVYFADTANGLIRKVEDGFIRVIAGRVPGPFDDFEEIGDGGPALEALLQLPFGLAVHRSNSGVETLYISDTNHFRVRKVSGDGTITTYAGGGATEGSAVGAAGIPATDIHIHISHGVAVKGRNLYISDAAANRLYKVVEGAGGVGTLTNFVGNGEIGVPPYGDGGPALEAQTGPKGLAMDKWGNLFIADTARAVVRKVR